MKVIHISEPLGGGSFNVIEQLVNYQVQQAYDVLVLHGRRDVGVFKERVKNTDPRVCFREIDMNISLSPYQDFKSLFSIIREIRKFQPDIIHLHSAKAGVLGRLACLILRNRKKCIYSPHGYSFLKQDVSDSKRALFRMFEKLCGRLGGVTVACSASEKLHAEKTLGLKNVQLVDNAVVIPSDFKSLELRTDKKRIQIATAARITYPKDPKRFASIAYSIDKSGVEFVWIGDGELRNVLVDNDPDQKIKITGWLDKREVISSISSSDVFLMTSLWEGMPLALIEAQLLGVPAVVPDVEGCRDVVQNNVTGFVCKDTVEMIAKIALLLEDSELRLKLGKNAKDIGLRRFSSQRMCSEIVKIYSRVPYGRS